MMNDFIWEDEEFKIERVEKTHILWEDIHTHSTKYMQHWIRKLESKQQQQQQDQE